MKGFCGKWVGKGKSAQPHNFIKDEYDRDPDYIQDRIDELDYCFAYVTQ